MKTKQHGICGGKYLLKTPGNAISETLNFQNVARYLDQLPDYSPGSPKI